ncbi:MAG: NAD(P)/FAD-dependent oxidoreductase [Syntrophorhabdaceae bacterium]|nr:NAD(P)/FAD-dependent oxidoreductase [Syntrophorhabdaceae bacterium]
MSKERILILGNGGAGINAAIAARKTGFKGEIAMVSERDGPVFNPMLSPYYLKGIVPWERCFPFDYRIYKELDIRCHFGTPVVELDGIGQEVTLGDGKKISFDRCLIATGASPVIPAIEGLEDHSLYKTIRTPASVLDLNGAIRGGGKAVVLGASLVGLKASEILKKRGMEVILVEKEMQVLPYGAHPLIAGILTSFLEEKGIEVRLGITLKGAKPWKGRVICDFGEKKEIADILLICTGVRANIDFIDPRQIMIDKGAIVDNRMATNVENIYAAGDACQVMDFLSNRHRWFGTWGFACKQGLVAGKNMAGEDVHTADFVMENISPIFDWMYAQVGQIKGYRNDVTYEYLKDGKDGHYLFVLHEGVVSGANLINTTHLAGMIRQAIYKRLPFSYIRQTLLIR